MAKNPVKNPVQPPQGGAAVVPGNPGNRGGRKGRSGRKPEWFKEAMRKLGTKPAVLKAAEKILQDPSHPQWSSVWKHVTEQGYGKATQPVEHGGEGGGDIRHALTVRFVKSDSDR